MIANQNHKECSEVSHAKVLSSGNTYAIVGRTQSVINRESQNTLHNRCWR